MVAAIRDVFTINPKNNASDGVVAGFVPMNAIKDGYSNSFSFEKRFWKDIKSGFTHFANGDVAVAKISPCLENRKSMVISDLPNGIGAGTTELLIFRSNVLIPEFALLFFKSDYFIKLCTSTFNGVVGQQRVGRNIVEQILVPIPPKSTQKKIATKIEELYSILTEIEASLHS